MKIRLSREAILFIMMLTGLLTGYYYREIHVWLCMNRELSGVVHCALFFVFTAFIQKRIY